MRDGVPATRGGAGRVVATAAALVLLAGLAYGVGQRSRPEPGAVGHGCVVEAGGTVHLDQEQMANAATIAAVGTRLGMPERAVVVAIATALQESKLRNLPHLGEANDHDSIGLFQQRPSQGWGSEEQLQDPRYAAERFYLALKQVPGWERMRLTDAAQRVQRSAFPEAYQKWEADATVLATALLGRASGAVTCSGVARAQPRGAEAAAAVREHLHRDWGEVAAVAVGLDGLGVSVEAGDHTTGWRYAHWLVAHAGSLGIARVHFGELEWRLAAGAWERAGALTNRAVVAEVVPGA